MRPIAKYQERTPAEHMCTTCTPATPRFRMPYGAVQTFTNVNDGDEVRLQLIGGGGANGGHCDECK